MKRPHATIIGIAAILLNIVTWAMDFGAIVGPCGYCRVQRTVIGLLGVLMVLPWAKCIVLRYIGNVLAFMGATVAALQHFNGWNDLSKGQFNFVWPLYANSFLLSAGALAVIVGQAMILNNKGVTSNE